jgi:beta-phosphoglucomutase-like phosphatase (HAD superfamily)
MDGLLIDSEDKYTLITNEILQDFGKPILPWSIKAQLQGRPAPDVSAINLSVPVSAADLLIVCQGQQNLPRMGQIAHHA